jgi:hypothetical protein
LSTTVVARLSHTWKVSNEEGRGGRWGRRKVGKEEGGIRKEEGRKGEEGGRSQEEVGRREGWRTERTKWIGGRKEKGRESKISYKTIAYFGKIFKYVRKIYGHCKSRQQL